MAVETLSIGADRGLTTAYGAAHFGKSLFWHCSGLLLAFFLTEVVGMSPPAMGLALGLSMMVSAVADVVVGRLCRGRLSRPETAARMQLWGSVLASGALLLLFAAPLMDASLRLAWAWGALLTLRIGYSVYDTPQNALMTLATRDAATRSSAAILRVGVSGLAALVLAAAIMPLLVATASSDPRERALIFIGLGVAMSGIAVAAAWMLMRVISRARWDGAGVDDRTETPVRTLFLSGRTMANLAPLLIMAFAFPFAMSAFGKLEPYYVTYVLRSPVWAGVLATAGALGVVVSPLALRGLVRIRTRRLAFLTASLGLLAACTAFALTARIPWAAAGAVAAIGMMGGGLNTLFWATLADEAATGQPAQVGAVFGLFTAVSKTAPALSAMGLGLLLGGLDYRGAEADQLIGLMSSFPIAGAVVCALVATVWRSGGAAGIHGPWRPRPHPLFQKPRPRPNV